jgi:hypothetical protein
VTETLSYTLTPQPTDTATATGTGTSSVTPTISPTPTDTLTPAPTPVFVSVSQDGDATGGGFTITVTGTGFLPGAVIYLDGTPLVTTYVGSGILTAIAPAHAPGSGTVTVANAGGAFAAGSGTVSFVDHGELRVTLAPMPVHPGQALCLYPSEALAESRWTLYGTDQQVVGRLHSTDAVTCLTETGGFARGAYLARIWVRSLAGTEKTFIKQVVFE